MHGLFEYHSLKTHRASLDTHYSIILWAKTAAFAFKARQDGINNNG